MRHLQRACAPAAEGIRAAGRSGPVLGLHGIAERFGAAQALAVLARGDGEVHAPLGENAAGKGAQAEGSRGEAGAAGIGVPRALLTHATNGHAPGRDAGLSDLGCRLSRTARGLAGGAFPAGPGVELTAGRMDGRPIEEDPTRPQGLRLAMGPSTVHDRDDVEVAAK